MFSALTRRGLLATCTLAIGLGALAGVSTSAGTPALPAGPLELGPGAAAPDPATPDPATPGPAFGSTTLPGGVPHVSADRTGVFSTTDGLTLRLTTDIGPVRVTPLAPGEAPVVRYAVHIETDAREPLAKHLLENYVLKTKSDSTGVEIMGALPPQSGRGLNAGAQFWVRFEITVPANYHVEVRTGAGNIEAQEIGGNATLVTQGGNIFAGRIGGRDERKGSGGRVKAVLHTEGGHIQVQEVAGDLTAFTAGGHIIAGDVLGDASLHSGGGHIRAGKIGGRADLETEGGNVSVNHAGAFVSVRTGGGQIDFGEVRGSVRAQTAGGGIRIMYVSGPMEVVSSGGSICLTRVSGAVQAATTDGTITAWINPEAAGPTGTNSTVRLAGASQLTSGNGDIVVFLPRNLAANIEAIVTSGAAANGGSGDAHRIEADPAIHLAMQTAQSAAPGSVRAIGTLNGGGETLRLKTSAGNIRLQFLDSQIALRESLIRDQQARLNPKAGNIAQVAFEDNFANVAPGSIPSLPQTMPLPEAKNDWLDGWVNALEEFLTGSLREDPADFQKRLTYAPHPTYPSIAQTQGIEGAVKLQVRVARDGHVEVLKLLGGEPVLADAAIACVKQWRGKPGTVGGKPVDVISTVTFNFQLH